MTTINSTKVSLRIIGDDLLPEDITDMLGCEPSHSQHKGQIITGKRSGHQRKARFGMWRIEAPEENPGDLNIQISSLLGMLSSDLNRWVELSNIYDIDLFCGLFMQKEMDGIDISPINLLALGQRSIELGLDIYGPDDENA